MSRIRLTAVLCLAPLLAAAGLAAEQWWAYRPLQASRVPVLRQEGGPQLRNPVDAFLLRRLQAENLSFSPEADRRTLIRRLYFDLIGLPPTYEEVERFCRDTHPAAYERLVDRLLASPHYGERWARHWLDVAHYADTHGFDKDKVRANAWPYRDYVIRSFNRDKPYGRFVLEQVAGDVLFPEDPDGVVATGFLVAGPFDWVGHIEVRNGTMEKKRVRNLDRDDIVTTVFNAFLSTTIQCARCHEHKFDPISEEEYYGLQAIFAGIDRADRQYDPDREVARRRRQLQHEIENVQKALEQVSEAIDRQVAPVTEPINRELASFAELADPGQKRPEFGFHSQIESTPEKEKWVQVDLGRRQPIWLVALVPCHDEFAGIGAGFGFPPQYRVEASDDPQFKTSTVLLDCTGSDQSNPGMVPQAVVLNQPVQARYVRVTATKLAHRRNDYIFALAELLVLDPGGRNLARGRTVSALDWIEAPPRWRLQNLVDEIYVGNWSAEQLVRLAELQAQRRLAMSGPRVRELRERQQRLNQRLSRLRRELNSLPPPKVVFAAATAFKPIGNFVPTRGKPRPVYVLRRGDVRHRIKPAVPRTVSCLADLPGDLGLNEQTPEGQRRAALARWIAHPKNPLTWRSIVNRVWQYHFGVGIVATPDDFGRMGERPSHPELLDWLAVWFRDSARQSLKRLHYLLVTTTAYRQTSFVVGDMGRRAQAIDAQNRLLWRMRRRRLEAEAVRDAALAVAGILERRLGGPPYRNFGFIDDHSPHYLYHQYDPARMETRRRSIYRFVVRSVPDPFMEAFDFPDPAVVTGRRNETLTPLQSLVLFNDPFILFVAEQWAERLERQWSDPASLVVAATRDALGRDPDPEELQLLSELVQQHGVPYLCRVLLNLNEFLFID